MSLKVDYFTLNATDVTTNKYVTLSATPDSSVALDIIGGTAQAFPGDFTVTDTTVSWSGKPLDGSLAENDQLRVFYDRS